jgi:hydrogenase expression/formation protein HypC
VLEVNAEQYARMARVDFGGVVREASLSFVPEAGVGDYVIVHAGFAISRLDEVEALETLRLMEEIGLVGEEEGEE